MEENIKNLSFTYILECSDKSLYTGWTNDLEKRIKSHNSGKGSKYTRARMPVKYVFIKEFLSKNDAMKLEGRIKKLTKAEKIELIKSGENHIETFRK